MVAAGHGSRLNNGMQCSAKEIETVATNAAVAAGLPFGLSEDVGRAGGWLQRRGYDGLAAVWRSIGGGIKQPLRIHYDDASQTFRHAQLAVCGAAVFDLLAVLRTADSSPSPIILRDADSPWLLVGLAGIAAADYDLSSIIQFADGTVTEVTAATAHMMRSVAPSKNGEMRVSLSDRAAEKSGAATAQKITVDKRRWRQLQALAAQNFVPSSTESRAKGAGAGLTDND